MLRIDHGVRVGGFLAGVAFLAASCGGRMTDGEGTTTGGVESLPTCVEICTHIVHTCIPGAAITTCVADCEGTLTRFASCPKELAPYLRCMETTAVECRDPMVTILDCSAERGRLENCGAP